jgi:hypothetical protein
MADMCYVLKVSPDGGSAYLAYLDDSETDVHIQQVDPTNFRAVGATMTVKGAKEGTCSHFIPTTSLFIHFTAGGLVAQNDGFALLTNLPLPLSQMLPQEIRQFQRSSGTRGGQQAWQTFLGGPGVHEDFGVSFSCMNTLLYKYVPPK